MKAFFFVFLTIGTKCFGIKISRFGTFVFNNFHTYLFITYNFKQQMHLYSIHIHLQCKWLAPPDLGRAARNRRPNQSPVFLLHGQCPLLGPGGERHIPEHSPKNNLDEKQYIQLTFLYLV